MIVITNDVGVDRLPRCIAVGIICFVDWCLSQANVSF